MRSLFLAALVAAMPACAGDPDPEPVAIAKGFAAIDLISPTTCQLKVGKLRQCVIPTTNHASPPMDTAVPLRTVLRRVQEGNCSTPYALRVNAALDGGPEVPFPFLSEAQVVLRKPDGGVVADVTVRDGSPWTGIASFDGSCRIAVELTSNEVDVDTVQQAEALLAAIDQELAAAEIDQRNYEALLALQAAYAFTESVASSFHADLTSETMQELRAAALDAAPAMEGAMLGCGDALSEEQRDTLFRLYVSMVALGDPASWQNPDGSTKSLADFYGPAAAGVLAQLEALAANASPDLETQYREGLAASAAEVVRLQQKRALAVVQLAPWLGGAP
jgi:hypothetical protein